MIIRKQHLTFFVFAIASFLSVQSNYAQTFENLSTIRSDLDDMFEHLEKNRIPTGLLSDYAVDLADLRQFDGVDMSDSSFVNTSTFEQILYSIRSSAPLIVPFGEVSSIVDSIILRVITKENISQI